MKRVADTCSGVTRHDCIETKGVGDVARARQALPECLSEKSIVYIAYERVGRRKTDQLADQEKLFPALISDHSASCRTSWTVARALARRGGPTTLSSNKAEHKPTDRYRQTSHSPIALQLTKIQYSYD